MSIRAAKNCGADAVKFQAFDTESLYGGDNWHGFNGLTSTDGRRNTLKLRGVLSIDWLPQLKAKADSVGIEFMCSAFSPELIDAVNPFVNVHKLASAEMAHVRMLEKLREIRKPLIMSTGGQGVREIKNSLEVLGHGAPEKDHLGGGPFFRDLILMYCVAAYPAREVNLGCIKAIRGSYRTLCGYSDHTLDVLEIPKRAVELGACVVEKHFNALSPGTETPDSPHSLDARQFKFMVDSLRGNLESRIGWTKEEQPMVSRHNRRLIATKDIAVGAIFKEGENFGIYRSLKDDVKGMRPFKIDDVNGKVAKQTIQAGDGIGPGDV